MVFTDWLARQGVFRYGFYGLADKTGSIYNWAEVILFFAVVHSRFQL